MGITTDQLEANEALVNGDYIEVYQPSSGGIRREKKALLSALETFFQDTLLSLISTNTSNISTNTSNISTNTSNISTNTSNIAIIQGQLLPIGTVYIQFPSDDDPATLNYPGTWSNVSSELAGDFIRFEGGNASTFESGQQLDQFQGFVKNIASTVGTDSVITDDIGAGSIKNGPDVNGNNVASNYPEIITKDFISDGVNGTPRTGSETRSVNRTVRKWRRIS